MPVDGAVSPAESESKEDGPALPKDISFKDSIFCIDCHPSQELIAVGLITGPVQLCSYTDKSRPSMKLKHHKKSCRVVKFSEDGTMLYTGSKDAQLCQVDVESGNVVRKVNKSHKSSIYSMHVVNTNTITTGDDNGVIKVWDVRSMSPVMESAVHSDFVSDITDNGHKTLIAVSGDGSLSVTDLRRHKQKGKSDTFESELLSVAIVKNGSKVICGDGDGTINIFNWNLWEDMTDRFPSHPQSIDCIVKITEDVVCTACMDGVIRAVQILPNQTILEVGRHSDELSVDHLSLTHDHEYLISSSQDCIKFWSVDEVIEARVKSDPMLSSRVGKPAGDSSSDSEDEERRKRRKRKKKHLVTKKSKTSVDFFADL